MKRREFITLLGGAAVAWPLAARAQQGERMRRIGVLIGVSGPDGQARATALAQGLSALNWHEGSNLRIDWRWAPVGGLLFWGFHSCPLSRKPAQKRFLPPKRG